MAVHRRAFALIIVLIATAAVFALAMQGAVAMRVATVEAGAMRRHAELRRHATTAAVRVLTALTDAEQINRGGAAAAADAGSAPEAPGAGVNEQELPDMPVEMRQFLEGLLQEQQQDGAGGPAAPPRRTTGRGGGGSTTLKRIGLPREPIEVEVGGRTFLVSLADAAGGVNLNEAGEDQLTRFFLEMGAGEPRNVSLAHELLDWRDEDNLPRSRGAERETYFRRGVTIRNGPLRAVEELLYLPSMTPDLFARLRDEVTIVGDGRLHAATASRAALLSLPGMTPAAADRLINSRRSGRLDDQAVQEALSVRSGRAAPMLRTDPSSFLRVRVASREGGPTFVGLVAVDPARGARGLSLRMDDGSTNLEGASNP